MEERSPTRAFSEVQNLQHTPLKKSGVPLLFCTYCIIFWDHSYSASLALLFLFHVVILYTNLALFSFFRLLIFQVIFLHFNFTKFLGLLPRNRCDACFFRVVACLCCDHFSFQLQFIVLITTFIFLRFKKQHQYIRRALQRTPLTQLF